MKKYILTLIVFSIYSVSSYSQGCGKYYEWAGCKQKLNDFEIYLQPKSSRITTKDTLRYNIVFIGKRDYIISFCTDKIYYSICIKLLNQKTKEVIYDNTSNSYRDELSLTFSNTQTIVVEAFLIGNKTNISNEKVCVGLIMQYKNRK